MLAIYTWRLSCRLSTISRTLNAAVKQLRSQMHTAVVDDAGVCEMDDITLRVLTRDCTALRKLRLGLHLSRPMLEKR